MTFGGEEAEVHDDNSRIEAARGLGGRGSSLDPQQCLLIASQLPLGCTLAFSVPPENQC